MRTSRATFGCGDDGWQWLAAAGEGNKVGGGKGWLFVFLMKTEFWILGVVKEGQRRNAGSKIFNQESSHK